MENYPMNRFCGRPYNTTCGMTRQTPPDPRPCIDQMEPAMAYVPNQKFSNTYDLGYALKAGTVFPELCKPFCGKRGGRK